jgi:hypothetical protein
MPNRNDITRAQAAVRTLEQTRAEARALLMPRSTEGAGGQSSAFPRSKTFRWLLTHSVARSAPPYLPALYRGCRWVGSLAKRYSGEKPTADHTARFTSRALCPRRTIYEV